MADLKLVDRWMMPQNGNGERARRWRAVTIAAISVGASVSTSSLTVGIAIGRYDEKLQFLYVDRAALARQVEDLTKGMKVLNDTTIALNVGVVNLKTELENARAELEHERQDRLDEERRHRFGGSR